MTEWLQQTLLTKIRRRINPRSLFEVTLVSNLDVICRIVLVADYPQDRKVREVVFVSEGIAISISEADNQVNIKLLIVDFVKCRLKDRPATATDFEFRVLEVQGIGVSVGVDSLDFSVTLDDGERIFIRELDN